MKDTPTQNRRKFYERIAMASWICPLAGVMFGMFALVTSSENLMIVTLGGVVMGVLVLCGPICTVVALFAISRYGKEKLLAPALVGLGVFLFFILILATGD